jgi:hypothetical protein
VLVGPGGDGALEIGGWCDGVCNCWRKETASQRSICIFARPVVGPDALPRAQRMQWTPSTTRVGVGGLQGATPSLFSPWALWARPLQLVQLPRLQLQSSSLAASWMVGIEKSWVGSRKWEGLRAEFGVWSHTRHQIQGQIAFIANAGGRQPHSRHQKQYVVMIIYGQKVRKRRHWFYAGESSPKNAKK